MRNTCVVALSFALLTGCNDYNLWGQSQTDQPGVDDPEGPTVDGPQPDIKLDPEQMSFGWRLVGCPAEPEEVTVTNVGDSTLQVNEIRVEGAGADMFSIDGAPEALAPGESFSFDVGFTARAVADYNVEVVVDSEPIPVFVERSPEAQQVGNHHPVRSRELVVAVAEDIATRHQTV